MDPLEQRLIELREKGLYRALRSVSSCQNAEIIIDGKQVINFSGNNSLGLASHPVIRNAAHFGIDRYGVGAGASRLISGNMVPHEKLEQALAGFMDKERALYFPSGYQANISVIPVIAGPEDLILSDSLNHASLIDGIRLSRAECRIYPHNDWQALQALLEEAPSQQQVLVVTESLFSMEGDRAPLQEIVALKRIRPFLLYLDEAHGLGATGPGGRGVAAEEGCAGEVDLLLGTLGKAFGVSGAFIACKKTVTELLINRARPFIYTTAPPAHLAEAARAALWEVERGEERRALLKKNASVLRNKFQAFLHQPIPGRDQIVPVRVPEASRVMEACAALLEEGIFCQGIRPPTVPSGECRLRFSVCVDHTPKHLARAAQALEKVLPADLKK